MPVIAEQPDNTTRERTVESAKEGALVALANWREKDKIDIESRTFVTRKAEYRYRQFLRTAVDTLVNAVEAAYKKNGGQP